MPTLTLEVEPLLPGDLRNRPLGGEVSVQYLKVARRLDRVAERPDHLLHGMKKRSPQNVAQENPHPTLLLEAR